MTERFGLPRHLRLRQQRDFDEMHHSAMHAADRTLVVLARRNGLAHCRLGIVVSRKVGKAHIRNRWKRLIREAFRLQQHELPNGLDLLVRPRKGATADYLSIARSLKSLVRKIVTRLPAEAPSAVVESKSLEGDS